MSRTKRGSKGPGHDLWSRRPCAGKSATTENKKLTTRKERVEERRVLHDKKRHSTAGE